MLFVRNIYLCPDQFRMWEHDAVAVLLRSASTCALVLAVALLAGCGADSPEETPPEQAEPEVVAKCKKAMLGSNDGSWREEATTAGAGQFGFLGPGRDFHGLVARKTNKGFVQTKIPAVVDGEEPVVVRVPDEYVDRVGLDYGDFREEKSIRQAASSVLFKPCANQPNTGWPGGLVLADRRPVTLMVELSNGEERLIRVGGRL
ncbi:MAG: hypothetical protein M3450_06555 [Actinomycetota bacterium]|nr:hypothetical protein [Actinomycetota bacterium]